MKSSFVVSIDDPEQLWKKRFSALASIGYDGVEIAVRDPRNICFKRLERCLIKNSLKVPAIATGQAYLKEGLSLSSCDKKIRDAAVLRIKSQIDLAVALNTQVIIGLIRGTAPAGREDKVKKSYNNLFASIGKICEYASRRRIVVTIEPINRYETSFLNTVAETLAFIRRFKCGKLKILLDTFHINIEESDFIKPFQEAKRYLSHVHFSDSNRRCPGYGHIDFKGVAATLKDIGYNGFCSAEILLAPDFKTCINKYIGCVR